MTDTHPFRSFQRPPRPRSLRAQVRWGCSQSMSDRSCFPECQGPSLISPPQTSQQLCEVSEIGSSPIFPDVGKSRVQCSETRLLGPAWGAVWLGLGRHGPGSRPALGGGGSILLYFSVSTTSTACTRSGWLVHGAWR